DEPARDLGGDGHHRHVRAGRFHEGGQRVEGTRSGGEEKGRRAAARLCAANRGESGAQLGAETVREDLALAQRFPDGERVDAGQAEHGAGSEYPEALHHHVAAGPDAETSCHRRAELFQGEDSTTHRVARRVRSRASASSATAIGSIAQIEQGAPRRYLSDPPGPSRPLAALSRLVVRFPLSFKLRRSVRRRSALRGEEGLTALTEAAAGPVPGRGPE